MAISGYMIACIVVIIFVVVSIIVLVFVIRWRRKKRKESDVDVPTQSNRATREQAGHHQRNPNSDDVSAPTITPSAPVLDTLRSHTDYDMHGMSHYLHGGGHTGHDYVNHNSKQIQARNDQRNNNIAPITDDRYSISMIYPSEAAGDYESPYNDHTSPDSHRDYGSDSYKGGSRNSGNLPSYDTRAPSSRYRDPTRSNRDEMYANTPPPYGEYEMATNRGYDTYGDSTPRRSYYDAHSNDLKTISATAV